MAKHIHVHVGKMKDSDPSLELAYAVEANPEAVGKKAKSKFKTESEFLAALKKGGMSEREACVQRALKAYREATKDANPDGSYDPKEDKEVIYVISKAVAAIEQAKRELNEIGGSFRGPGYRDKLKKAILPKLG